MMKKQYYYVHVYLRGNRKEDLFYDQTDFRCVWNRMWLAAYYTDTQILAAELLTNHFHIIIKVEAKIDCEPGESKFMHYFRMSMTHYINKRYDVSGSLGARNFGRSIIGDIKDDNGNDLRDAICYTLRNVKHHNIQEDFLNWKWSTARSSFGIETNDDIYVAPSIPKDRLKHILPSGIEIPNGWKVTTDNIILPPANTFDSQFVEELFDNKDKYLQTLDQVTLREQRNENESDSFKKKSNKKTLDLDIIGYIHTVFQTNIPNMNTKQKLNAAKEICKVLPEISSMQLSRILGIPYTTLTRNRAKW